MGIFGGLSLLIGGTIAAAVASVTVIVASIVTAVVAAVAAVAAAVTAVISIAVTAVSGLLSGVVTLLPSSLIGIETKLALQTALQSGNIFTIATALKGAFSAFLTAIHFTTIMNVHNIAFLVSAQYRDMMRKVWGQIAEFAKAVELPVGYLETAINIARNTVLDVSSFFGRSYDLSEVVWLQDFQNLLGRIQDTSANYRKNPQRIWEDLNELIIKPAIDNKAAAQRNIFSTIEGIIGFGEKTLEDINEIRLKYVADLEALPFKWSEDIALKANLMWGQIESWRSEIYLPYISQISGIIDILERNQIIAKEKLYQLYNDLSRPADYLRTIDNMPDGLRLEQEYKLAEIVTRAERTETKEWNSHVAGEITTMEAILKALAYKPPPLEWYIPEIETPAFKAGKQTRQVETWFVGDY